MQKILIACPSNRGIQPKTFQCLMELVEANKRKYDLKILIAEEGYTTAENRNYIAVQAVNGGFDYLLTIDDDMTFSPDTLDRLIEQRKDIIGVAYHSRGSNAKIKIVPSNIMSIATDDKGKYIDLETDPDPKYKDTFECYATGTGMMLIKTEIFLKIKRPWFEFTYFENGKCEYGEDWNFCFRAKEAGFKIYSDPKIKVGHIGEVIW